MCVCVHVAIHKFFVSLSSINFIAHLYSGSFIFYQLIEVGNSVLLLNIEIVVVFLGFSP